MKKEHHQCFFLTSETTISQYDIGSAIKFLIGITPQGTVSIVSKCAGGRMSDKEIMKQSGLMAHLLPGNLYEPCCLTFSICLDIPLPLNL